MMSFPYFASNVTVTVVESGEGKVMELEDMLTAEDGTVLMSYDFTVSGYSAAEIILSYGIDQNYEKDSIKFWHNDGTWHPYTPRKPVLSYSNYLKYGWVSMDVNSFSSYAITGVIIPPIPGTVILLQGSPDE